MPAGLSITIISSSSNNISKSKSEDIFSVAENIDKMTNAIENVAFRLWMFNIKEIRSDMHEFIDLIGNCCDKITEIIAEFKNFKKSTLLKGLVVKLNDLEEHGDRLYIQAVRKLSTEDISTRDVIEWRDVYRNFENCFDAAETVADNIESATMKNS